MFDTCPICNNEWRRVDKFSCCCFVCKLNLYDYQNINPYVWKYLGNTKIFISWYSDKRCVVIDIKGVNVPKIIAELDYHLPFDIKLDRLYKLLLLK